MIRSELKYRLVCRECTRRVTVWAAHVIRPDGQLTFDVAETTTAIQSLHRVRRWRLPRSVRAILSRRTAM